MSIVRKATAEDLGRICRTVMLAFAEEPVVRWLYPDDEQYFAGDGATMRPFLGNLLRHDESFITDDCVSVALFVPPGRPELEMQIDPNSPPVPADQLERFTALGTAMREHTPPVLHWYLNVLGTHPHWRRQGLGALVMGPRLETCDHDGIPMYLETGTIENVAYYSHLGFSVRDEWDVPSAIGDGPHLWGMLREPCR